MKKVFIAFSLIIAVALCCSCGPSLKSVKDADSFLIQDRLKSVAKGGGGIYVYKKKPERMEARGSASTADFIIGGPVYGIAKAGAVNPFTLRPREGKKITGTVELKTSVILGNYHLMYRKEGNGPEWDIETEALKRAGQPPQHNACEASTAGVFYATINSYIGSDGTVRLSKYPEPYVRVRQWQHSEIPCVTEDLPVYDEYLDRITNSVKEIITEENERLDKAGQGTAIKK